MNVYRLPSGDFDWALLRRGDDFGIETLDLVRPTGRFWSDCPQVEPLVRMDVDARRTQVSRTPAALLQQLASGDSWQAMTRRSTARLAAWFVLAEDPQRRLETRAIATLAHQASLVEHVSQTAGLERVLIADEVGLGKTVEAGLLIQRLLQSRPGARVLYLAPARLVSNVRREFARLGLQFRIWVAGPDRDATLNDPLVIASIHRAAANHHLEEVVASKPWDMIVVDECHHLSDWARGGGKPVRRYRLVDGLRRKMQPEGRFVLMSGTPHQGHPSRFENILALLRTDGEDEGAISGRVIYRTKEDVTDWDGQPLFPLRRVNAPFIIDLGPEHRAWLAGIHDFFEPGAGNVDEEPTRRAAGWRCGQALQWATSSVQAGLGYLVRQAIRAGWTLRDKPLVCALEHLRPYRGGPADERIGQLFDRLRREIGRQLEADDIDDIEEMEDANGWKPDRAKLAVLLQQGVELTQTIQDRKWQVLQDQILSRLGDEKLVLFAQPIETVTALAAFLERTTGVRPSLIIGHQDEETRKREIEAFWRADGPQFLVSSRAGGEGINLQVASRLVHVDVPWNPMELEQRVGRIHRFLSRRTIVVDTLLVKDSREVDAYAVARRKLKEISSMMVPQDRFEALFARVMALVPPEELADILGDRPSGPLDDDDCRRVSALVHDGFERWQSFHGRYAESQKRLQRLDPGQATWRDLSAFAKSQLGGTEVQGFGVLGFRWHEGEVVESSSEADVLEIGGSYYAFGDFSGMPVTNSDAVQAQAVGTNSPLITQALRKAAFPTEPVGAAHVRLAPTSPLADVPRPFGILVLACMLLRNQQQVWTETGLMLDAYVVTADQTRRLQPEERARLVRALQSATVRREAHQAPALIERLVQEEQRLSQELRRPSDVEVHAGIRHAVFPLLAAVVS